MDQPLLFKNKDKPSLFSRLFFFQTYPLLKLANTIPLENEMIQPLNEDDQAFSIYSRFQFKFRSNTHSKYALYKSLFSTFKTQFIFTYILLLIYNILTMYVPVLINQSLTYLSSDHQNTLQGIIWISTIVVVRMLTTLLSQHSQYLLRKMGNDQCTAVSVSIMNKSLAVSFLSNKSFKSGEIINIMQVDTQRILTFNYSLATALFIPIQLGLSLYLLFSYIGISFLSGLGVMFITMGLNFLQGRIGWKLQKRVMTAKDARTKQANEIFQSIKFIKVNAFEDYFKQKLTLLRNEEIRLIRNRMIVSCVFILSLYLSPQLILNATLATFVWIGENLTPANTFSIISLFAILQGSVTALPSCVNSIIEANISIQRIQRYLLTDELMNDCITQGEQAVQFNSATFYWEKQKNQDQIKLSQIEPQQQPLLPILKDLNFQINMGEFVAIIGDVGSGKSSLIQAMIGEMIYMNEETSIKINGSIAYVSQKSWIQNATVQSNIIMGDEFDQKRYDEAIEYSCLRQDLKILDNGDQTMIGEKGVNLSGGQKARISLARALYQNADIYLLDDPISAVDIHVGKFIIEQCLNNYLKNKTIILVTHALQTCQYADRIILMENGEIIQQGTFTEIKQTAEFQRVYDKFFKNDMENEEDVEQDLESELKMKKLIMAKKQPSIEKDAVKGEVDDLMLLEDRKKGEVSFDVLKAYFYLNGGWRFFSITIFFTMMQAIGRFGGQIWLAKWSTETDITKEENYYYLEIFSVFTFGIGMFALFRTLTTTLESIKTAKKMHNQMIDALMLAPICQFFERIPIGVLMNRLTKDQAVLDTDIFWTISILQVNIFNLIGTTFMNIYSSTYLIVLPILLFFYVAFRIQRFYMAANRELYRLESISKSPILSYFSETVNGVSIIRAYGKQNQFLDQHCNNIDLNRRIQLTQLLVSTWFQTMLTFLSYVVNISAIIYTFFFGSKNPALAGLLMTVATYIDISLMNAVQNFGQAETQFISFERCLAFTKISPEIGMNITYYQSNWPHVGQINFNKLVVRYRENISPALRGLSVNISSQEKIGVVGRTGAGKSTITLSLLRILEASEGNIQIDGVDISTLSLQQLRQSITMILQDAILFEGSLRDNLDPLKSNTDLQILDVANLCCLTNFLEARQGLDTFIHEGGDNLSAGEKQLIGIARAVLKKAQIVLIDEATANIDIETEQKIQQTIKEAFQKCTVITIAHRINTILHCDKILVIDQGEAKEFDTPQILLQDPNSLFYGLYQEALKTKKI